ncbi:cupin-like domain-containing protein [Vibrio mediterranei]
MQNQFTVDEVDKGIAREAFLTQYVAKNQPLIIRGYARDWPALMRWDVDTLRRHFGHLNVLCSQSETHKHPDLTNARHNRHIPKPLKMSDYLDRIVVGPAQETAKLALNRLIFDSGEQCQYRHHIDLSPLAEDFTQPALLDGASFEIGVLWMQAQLTQSWLHTDAFENLFVQVQGKKRFMLYAPQEAGSLYNTRKYGAYCEVNAFEPDLAEHPLYENAHAMEVMLEAGDMLYLPAFWFHAVESLDTFNISMNWWHRADALAVSQPSLQFLLKKSGERAQEQLHSAQERKAFMDAMDKLNEIISCPEQASLSSYYR